MITIGYKSFSSLSGQPIYVSTKDAGMTIYSSQNIIIPENSYKHIHTSMGLQLPAGYVGIITSIGALAKDFGITTLYDEYITSGEEIKVSLKNNTEKEYEIHLGDKIAQVVFQKIELGRLHRIK